VESVWINFLAVCVADELAPHGVASRAFTGRTHPAASAQPHPVVEAEPPLGGVGDTSADGADGADAEQEQHVLGEAAQESVAELVIDQQPEHDEAEAEDLQLRQAA